MRNIKLIIEYDGKEFGRLAKTTDQTKHTRRNRKSIRNTYKRRNRPKCLTAEQTVEYTQYGQVANFKTNSEISLETLKKALNANLKNSIRIKKVEEVEENFHARLSCKEKTYRYVINNTEEGSSILRNYEYHIPQKLDIQKMQEAVKYFEGTHDFAGFKASGTSSKSSVRTIYKAEVQERGDRITIELTGNGFLYNMVRIISGTLVEVGLGKIAPKDIPEIINSKDRERAGKTLPAHGLYLVEVRYK